MELSNIYLIEIDYRENHFSNEYHLNFSLIVSYEILKIILKIRMMMPLKKVL